MILDWILYRAGMRIRLYFIFMKKICIFLPFALFVSACDNREKLTAYLSSTTEVDLEVKTMDFIDEISFLFIIDNSGSMGVFNEILSENIKTFLRSLFVNYPHYNYNFAITQTLSRDSKGLIAEKNQKSGKKIERVDKPLFFEEYPNKCYLDTSPFFVNTGIGPYLHHSFKDLQTVEQEDIICIISYNIQHLKNHGEDVEPLFDSLSYIVEQSKEPPYLEFRKQFFGQNKLLILFFLSDQWGQYDKMYYDKIQRISSPEEKKEEVIRKVKKVADSFSAKQLKLLQSVMGESWQNLRTYAVVLDNRRSDRCGGEEGGITPDRYPFHLYSLIEKTGGLRLSICDPSWGVQLKNIFDDLKKSLGFLFFYIDEVPKIDTIEVFLNNKKIPRDVKTGWSFDPENLSVNISPDFDYIDYRTGFDKDRNDQLNIKYQPFNIELLRED